MNDKFGEGLIQLRLDPKARTYWLASTTFEVGATGLALVLVSLLFDLGRWDAIAWLAFAMLVMGALAFLCFVVPMRLQTYVVHLDDKHISVRRGRWWRTNLIVPRRQILALKRNTSVIQRKFGLESLHLLVLTQSYEIGPLTPEQADQIADGLEIDSGEAE